MKVKIIFESEEERQRCYWRNCPQVRNGDPDFRCMNTGISVDKEICRVCWEESGIEMEVGE